jgi:hypothetical protein
MRGPGLSAAWVAWQLGGDGRANGSGWFRSPCPAHHGDALDTLALRDGAYGLITKCFKGCTGPVIRDAIAVFLASGLPRSGTAPAHGAPIRQDDEQATVNEASARRNWGCSVEIDGTPGERYFRDRGITITLPGVLRFHPAVWRSDHPAGAPAILAAVVDVHGDQQAIHRTWIPALSSRLKRALGPCAGCAVRLAEAADAVAITEGIESALSLAQLTGLPTWAALSTGGMHGIVLPKQIRDVVIGADNDINGAGLATANALRERLLREGRRARVILPKTPGTDFNDVLMGNQCSD